MNADVQYRAAMILAAWTHTGTVALDDPHAALDKALAAAENDPTSRRVVCEQVNPAGTHSCVYKKGHDGQHSWQGAGGYGRSTGAG